MSTTPRAYEWEGYETIATGVSETGSTLHYYTGIDAQHLYVDSNGRITSRRLEVTDGHWGELTEKELKTLSPTANKYIETNFTHPSTGTVYGVGIDDAGAGYASYPRLFYYDYMRDVSEIVTSGTWKMQLDNPISQIDLTLKNISQEMFIEDTSLFVPGGKIELGLTMGDSAKLPIGVAYIDEIDLTYNSQTADVSGRNVIGYKLNDQKTTALAFPSNTTVTLIAETLLGWFGIERYVVEETEKTVTYSIDNGSTGVECLQLLSDLASDSTVGNNWKAEVMPDGTIICGYDAFRANYLAKGHFEFNGRDDLFQRKMSKSIDGVYTSVYATGTGANNNELHKSVPVTTWEQWEPGEMRVYYPEKLKGVTQAELDTYAENVAAQLRLVGVSESYTAPIRPQLLVGDVADLRRGDVVKSLGTITEITHSFGEKGYTTDFTVSSGGDATDVQGHVYTNNRDVKGNARKKRISDYIT